MNRRCLGKGDWEERDFVIVFYGVCFRMVRIVKRYEYEIDEREV